MTDEETVQALACPDCEGRGYIGDAYWDEELEWYIYESNGESCELCQGTGVENGYEVSVKLENADALQVFAS